MVRIDYRCLIHSVDKNPCVLLCSVYVVVSCLTLGLLSPNWKIFDSRSAQAYVVFFEYPRPRRCLCWDHALSLAFENNITLSSWRILTKEYNHIPGVRRRANWWWCIARETYVRVFWMHHEKFIARSEVYLKGGRVSRQPNVMLH
ncbi:hypothetical protein BDR05DRAFT_464058 [Suillus weaverae]|nr:hypothetical protein BDR05DRAFT_464058 [Suillus weaverae]